MGSEYEGVGDHAITPHRYLGNEHPAHLGVSCVRYQEGERPAAERRVQTVAVDFDGVIHRYSRGWHDGTIYDEPEPGTIEGIRKLQQEYAVYVHTSRDPFACAFNQAVRDSGTADRLGKFLCHLDDGGALVVGKSIDGR